MIAWNSRKFIDNNYLMFIGIAYLFIGLLDMVHMLSYKGMGVFQGYGANLPTQLWIAARYVEGLTLLTAPLFMSNRIKVNKVFYGYLFVTALLLTTIFYLDIFPGCFVEGVGLTRFKKVSEYIIALILVVSLILLLRKRSEFNKNVLALLSTAIVLTIGSELAFTFYVSVYGVSNLVGHYFKIISFFLIYKAIIETGLQKPYAVLFKNLKNSEKSLRESEAKFRLLCERAPLGYQSLDENGHFIEVNKTWLDALGYSRDEVVGKSFGDFLHPDWTDHFKDNFPRFKAIGEVLGVEFEMVKKDGSIILVSFNGKIGKDEKGNFQQAHCIFHDITEHRQAEEALRESEEKYRHLFENLYDVYYRTDDKGIIILFSPSVEKYFGYTPDELIGQNIKILYVNPLERDGLLALLIQDGFVNNFEVQLKRKDNSVIWVSTNAKVIKDENGNFIGVEGITRDVTEQKQMENDIQALVESTVGIVGPDCFEIIVKKLCQWLDCECAILGEIVQTSTVQALAMEVDGKLVDGYSYELTGSPGGSVVEKGFRAYPQGVCDLFPQNRDLAQMNAVGYIGTPIVDGNNEPIGILCAISRRKLNLPKRAKEVITTFLLPTIYWQKQTERTKNPDLKESYLYAFEKAQLELEQHPLTSSLIRQEKWLSWAEWMVSNFQRTSSAIEGRNGWLSQIHHNGRGLTTKRLKALTIIHNYYLKRSDGTTAAERLFGRKFADPFEWLVEHMGDLPLARRSKYQVPVTC